MISCLHQARNQVCWYPQSQEGTLIKATFPRVFLRRHGKWPCSNQTLLKCWLNLDKYHIKTGILCGFYPRYRVKFSEPVVPTAPASQQHNQAKGIMKLKLSKELLFALLNICHIKIFWFWSRFADRFLHFCLSHFKNSPYR